MLVAFCCVVAHIWQVGYPIRFIPASAFPADTSNRNSQNPSLGRWAERHGAVQAFRTTEVEAEKKLPLLGGRKLGLTRLSDPHSQPRPSKLLWSRSVLKT
jgi:hypothetical protein